MIQAFRVVFCEEEHGFGDVFFPDPIDPSTHLQKYPTRKAVWRDARAAGWRRIQGADYCPDCAAGMKRGGE
jgi:hypothetical protein